MKISTPPLTMTLPVEGDNKASPSLCLLPPATALLCMPSMTRGEVFLGGDLESMRAGRSAQLGAVPHIPNYLHTSTHAQMLGSKCPSSPPTNPSRAWDPRRRILLVQLSSAQPTVDGPASRRPTIPSPPPPHDSSKSLLA